MFSATFMISAENGTVRISHGNAVTSFPNVLILPKRVLKIRLARTETDKLRLRQSCTPSVFRIQTIDFIAKKHFIRISPTNHHIEKLFK
jgi:hypothetical protein